MARAAAGWETPTSSAAAAAAADLDALRNLIASGPR